MDPPEVVLLSSDDELFDPGQRISEEASSLFDPGQRFSKESSELSRGLFNPQTLIHALEESLEGTTCRSLLFSLNLISRDLLILDDAALVLALLVLLKRPQLNLMNLSCTKVP